MEEVEKLKIALSKEKLVAMLAPSFVAEFKYPEIILQLRELGFDKVVELTFGAKMVNREYHKILKKSKSLVISSTCPGIVQTLKNKKSLYAKNIAQINSPMIAMNKICKKTYPKHKTVFISPCHFKKIEAKGNVDYVIDFQELRQLLEENKKPLKNVLNKIKAIALKDSIKFDKFYNDYTKVYPLSGGLSKTAHLKDVLNEGEERVIDGIIEVEKFLQNPDKKIRFLDVTFCEGGCVGGPCLSKQLTLEQKRQKVLDYMKKSESEKIPEESKGIIEKAKGINFKN